MGGQEGLDRVNRIKELEQEVSRSTEVALRLQRELAEANTKLSANSGTAPANQKRQNTPAEGVFFLIFLFIRPVTISRPLPKEDFILY